MVNVVVRQYVESVLETSGDDFESTDDLYEAIGEVSSCMIKISRHHMVSWL